MTYSGLYSDYETAVQLARFPYRNGHRLSACAAIHPRIAQLAWTHPVAFFALATACGPIEARQRAISLAVEGKPLATVSAALGLPLCFRHLPPEICRTRFPYFRWSTTASKRLAQLMPQTPRAAQAWLAGITFAARMGDEEIAIWLARHHKLLDDGRTAPRLLLPLILFAWHTRYQPELLLGVQGWSPDLDCATTVTRTAIWLKRAKLNTDLGPGGLTSGWLPEGRLRGLRFVPLTTAADLIGEADAMHNCVVEYGEGLARNICRLFSVSQGEQRIATLDRPAYFLAESKLLRFLSKSMRLLHNRCRRILR